ncbi:MAG: tRNA guanosine(15) transglycosylase TgtA [Candidatus Bathyarchaeota archaeon]
MKMAFEVLHRDLLGRIGKLTTKSGVLETPAFLPVINPNVQQVSPKEMFEKLRFKAVITNAYILKKHFEEEIIDRGVHDLLSYPGAVMTDSGAYQILRYGQIDADPIDIAKFQEKINTDIGVILDVPTGWVASHSYAEMTVKETIRRAEKTLENLERRDILWVGPIQGGRYLDLVALSARKMAKLPFDIYALGSPTQIMEQYLFDTLTDMIMTAKINLPPHKPLHLFGAGHPCLFPFIVALGCDIFDSAAYAIYAREERYLTENGTIRLQNLEYLPCSCPICSNLTSDQLKERWKEERESLLARHNLYVCMSEIQRVKQAITEGRLWELLELRAKSHPSLFQALNNLKKYSAYLEKHTPVTKGHGIFIYDSTSLHRPEVLRHRLNMTTNYEKPKGLEILLLLPQISVKPLHSSPQYRRVKKTLERVKRTLNLIHVCFYTTPFGIVPIEIDDIFPLSQFEMVGQLEGEMKAQIAEAIIEYVRTNKYKKVLLHPDYGLLDKKTINRLNKQISIIETTKEIDPWTTEALEDLEETLKKVDV